MLEVFRISSESQPFKHQPYKMVKYTQTIRQFADELFESVWPFCGVGRLKG